MTERAPILQPRPGATLTEVLVAIFVMGIGLLSLLVLFPLGALQMAQAIHDDRCTHAGITARALGNMVVPYSGNSGFTLKDDPFTVYPYYFYQLPGVPGYTTSYNLPLTLPDDGPSYPVYIDPIGVKLSAGSAIAPRAPASFATSPAGILPTTFPFWISQNFPGNLPPAPGAPVGFFTAAPSLAGFPRVSPSFINVNSFQSLERWCMMPDDIQFQEDATPVSNGLGANTPGSLQRESRYSWAWLCRQVRPDGTHCPTPMGVDMTVVVYDRRPITQGPAGAPMGETTYAAQFNFGSNIAYLVWPPGSAPPNLRRGTWIMDATMNTGSQTLGPVRPPATPPNVPTLAPPSGGGNFGKPNGYLYRVVNATVDSSINAALVELHMPARASSGPPANIAAGTFGIAVVMEGVAEVYERGPTTPQ